MARRNSTSGRRNPVRETNTHDARSSAGRFKSAVTASENAAIEAASAGERGSVTGMLDHVLDAAFWLGVAKAERRYAEGERFDPVTIQVYESLLKREPSWGSTITTYLRDAMGCEIPGVAANPSRRAKKKTRGRRARRT